MLEAFYLRISVECQACRISIPLNGLIAEARCYHCGETNRFDHAFWRKALPPTVFSTAMESPGKKHEFALLDEGLHLEFLHGAPSCESCHGSEIDLASLEEFATHGSCACTACGARIPVRRADADTMALNSGARYVLNEEALDAAGEALQARNKPVVFQCMSCGASLPVDGSTRLVPCKYCSADNYLPDGLWQIFNPVPKPVPFFVVCEYETAADLAARRAERASRATEGDELGRLAGDTVPQVRRAVAANPATPPEVLERLAFDYSRQVLEGLAANPNLPSHIVDEMAQSKDPEFQRLAARHPNLTPAHLPHLVRDGAPHVQSEAKARLASLQAQGVEVDENWAKPPIRGFFSRLFGG